jgi:hypothetical protein
VSLTANSGALGLELLRLLRTASLGRTPLQLLPALAPADCCWSTHQVLSGAPTKPPLLVVTRHFLIANPEAMRRV